MKKFLASNVALIAVGIVGVSAKEELAVLFNADSSTMLYLMTLIATAGAAMVMLAVIAMTLTGKEKAVLLTNKQLPVAIPTNNISYSRKTIQLHGSDMNDEWLK